MLDEAKVTELRTLADTRLASLMAQKAKLESDMSTLQEQYNLRQRQLNTTTQAIIETHATLSSFNAVLGVVDPTDKV